ncbi:MAG: DEAD/DEAH box helicase family protein [Candidatus Sericytochromatia bacterium]|nr:DEAD/DEAH box helicase family protein [Candidatus Sericytochromatia bacterium]
MMDDARFEKLVRDAIPGLQDEPERQSALRRVSDEAIAPHVALKLLEEAWECHEAAHAGNTQALEGELADLFEVVHRLMALHGISPEAVEATRLRKRQARGGFEQNWLLANPPRTDAMRGRVWTGPAEALHRALSAELATCTRASLAVAFGRSSSLELLSPAISGALHRGAQLRILTSDYLDLTEPEFLLELLALSPALSLRIYSEPGRSYHPKCYLFEQPNGRHTAFIGSSNLSRSALESGVEWNYQVRVGDAGWPFHDLLARFEGLWLSPHAHAVTPAWVAAYAERRQPRSEAWEPASPPDQAVSVELLPTPNPAQREALAALAALREDGERKGLVIAATGIGKTFLAAFDSGTFGRVLFLAHRDELLQQAHASFARVRPAATRGFYGGGLAEGEAELVFASVATISRPEHLARFAPDHFDYIVVDEVHHAAAPSYRAVLHHFAPRFLLGLTATPYRADNQDIFGLCDGNVAYRVTFLEAIALGWLAPFRYFGVHDATNYDAVPWRNGAYDVEALSRAVETQARAQAAWQAYLAHPSRAALGFCVSIRHAEFMARFFSELGVPAVAVHSGPGAPDRTGALAALRTGQARILFTVDLFNEGVDVPELDLVLFLRPTDSVTVFLQQLGRGLRLHPGKSFVTVVDFIGNYRRAHLKVPVLLGLEPDTPAREVIQAMEAAAADTWVGLPPGVKLHLDWQAIDLLTAMVQRGEPRREALIAAYREVAENLGHPPSLLELHRWGRFAVRSYRQEFRSWHAFLQTLGTLDAAHQQLESEVGSFLLEVEQTPMTRAFKMVVLEAFVRRGGLDVPVAVDALVADFRAYFAASPHRQRDLGPEVAALDSVPPDRLRAYVMNNPIAAWTNPGKGKRRLFFSLDGNTLRYTGPSASDPALFRAAVEARLDWRLTAYFERRYERRDTFRVIHNAGDQGLIQLGDGTGDGLPRGWVAVLVGGRRLWAKVAKVAINVLKTEPVDGPEVPNLLTEVLEGFFGPGGYRSTYRNQVRLRPAEEAGVWVIEPVGPRQSPP